MLGGVHEPRGGATASSFLSSEHIEGSIVRIVVSALGAMVCSERPVDPPRRSGTVAVPTMVSCLDSLLPAGGAREFPASPVGWAER
jgi:hypothetical protein